MELVALSAVVLVVVLGVLFGVPHYRSGSEDDRRWPDPLDRMDAFSRRWIDRPRLWDVALGTLTIVLIAAAVAIYRDPGILGGLAERGGFVAHGLAILGFLGLVGTTHLSVRRAGLRAAEATLIGMILAGVVLLVLIVGLLIV